MSRDAILERIQETLGINNICERLVQLPAKDLQSLLLYVSEARARNESAMDILRQSETNRFVSSSMVSQRILNSFDQIAISLLPEDFDSIELSPVAPFGTNAALAGTDQKNVATTMRLVEVNADSTTSLALECAKRRAELISMGFPGGEIVKLATSHRILRTQNFDKIPGFSQHFKVFALATAGLNDESSSFDVSTLIEHIRFYLRLFQELSQLGCTFSHVTVALSDIRITEMLIGILNIDRDTLGLETQNPNHDCFTEKGLELPGIVASVSGLSENRLRDYKILHYVQTLGYYTDQIFPLLRNEFPSVKFVLDLRRVSGIGYYKNICLKISAKNCNADKFPLVDGGTTDWTERLLSSKKELLFTSGIGTEIVCRQFR